MTICIAAIADNSTVIGASDRMITSGDIQFEPNRAKTRSLTNSIVVLTAGDATLQEEVLLRVKRDVAEQIDSHPDEWVRIPWAAERYVHHWTAIRRERAERALLWPIGISDTSEFLARQAKLSEKLSADVVADLLRWQLPTSACIIAGVDASGPHLWRVEDGHMTCCTGLGFASVGSGGRRAESHMMLAQHCSSTSLSDTLLLVHSAKRRAEISPGVGAATDLWLIGALPGSYTAVHDEIVSQLDKQFVEIQEAERRAMESAKGGVLTYLMNRTNQAPEGQLAAPDAAALDPTDAPPENA